MTQVIAVPTPRVDIPDEELAAMAFLTRYLEPTRSAYAGDLRIFFTWCYEHGVAPLEAKRPHIEFYARYLESERHNRPASVHRRLSSLKAFFDVAAADDLIIKSPATWVRLPKIIYDEARTLGLDRQAMSSLIYAARAAGPMDDALIAILAMLGLRVSEACGIDIEDFAETERGHTVLRLVGKGGKPATIPLPPPVLRSMRRAQGERTSGPLLVRRDGERLDRNTAARWVRRVSRAAGITAHVHPHLLRHGAITAALDAGVSLRDAQVFARHADPRTTTRYDRGRLNLDRHAAYPLAAFLAGAA